MLRISLVKEMGRVLRDGAWNGVRTFLKLMVVVAPVYTIVTALKYTGTLDTIAHAMAPAMKYFGLPGEAAMALVVGNLINLYTSLGVIAALKLTPNQVTVLSLMLLISHSQILETAVFFQIRARWWLLWLVRLGLAVVVGWGLGHLLIR